MKKLRDICIDFIKIILIKILKKNYQKLNNIITKQKLDNFTKQLLSKFFIKKQNIQATQQDASDSKSLPKPEDTINTVEKAIKRKYKMVLIIIFMIIALAVLISVTFILVLCNKTISHQSIIMIYSVFGLFIGICMIGFMVI